MHQIEPFYNWRDIYKAEEDDLSPFYKRKYSELYYTDKIYNFYIHPQWDNIGSSTLYIKILFVNYEKNLAVIELIGEWNDAINNDIMYLKRDVIDLMIEKGISKFVLIGENVLNFHYSDREYYEEWIEDISENDGWVALVNFQEQVVQQFEKYRINSIVFLEEELMDLNWRAQNPFLIHKFVEQALRKYLG
jgi:hypothetical protein